MLRQWRHLIALGLAVVGIAAGVAVSAVSEDALVGWLIKLLGIGFGMWYLRPQIHDAIATMRSPTKKVRSVLAVAAIAAVAISIPHAAQTLILRTFVDPEHRFTISVPVTWETATSTGGRALTATAPVPATGLPDSVDVIVRDMPMAISARDCVRQAERIMRFVLHAWTNLSEGPDTIADLPAYTHAYAWHTKAGGERRSLQVCMTLGHRVFMLIGTTDITPDGTREALPVLTGIIDTFRPAALRPEAPASGPSPQAR